MKQSIKRVLALALAAIVLIVSLALPVFMGLGAQAAETPTETEGTSDSAQSKGQDGTNITGDAPEAVLQALDTGLAQLQEQGQLPAPKNGLRIAERTALYSFDLETFKKNNDLNASQHFVQWVFTIHDGDSFYARAGIAEDLGQARFAGIEYDNESIDQTAKKIRDLNQTPSSFYLYNNQLYLLGADEDGARNYYTVAKNGGSIIRENDMKNLLLRDHNLVPVSSAGSESATTEDKPQEMNTLTLYLLIMGGIVLVIVAVIVIANLSKRGGGSAPTQGDMPASPPEEPQPPAESDDSKSSDLSD